MEAVSINTSKSSTKREVSRLIKNQISFHNHFKNDIKHKSMRIDRFSFVLAVCERYILRIIEINAIGIIPIAYNVHRLRESNRSGHIEILFENFSGYLIRSLIISLKNNRYQAKAIYDALKSSRTFDSEDTANSFEHIIRKEVLD